MTEKMNSTYLLQSLYLVFWGTIIVFFDLSFSQTSNNSGWKIDIFNDFIGMLMISRGVFQLSTLLITPKYYNIMVFVLTASILEALSSLDDHLIYARPPFIQLTKGLINTLGLIATLLFCQAMYLLSLKYELKKSVNSWKTTFKLFFLFNSIPYGLLIILGTYSLLSNTQPNNGLFAILIFSLVLVLIPIIYFFFSISTMRAEITESQSH
jgi:hypothetical protein